MSYPLAAARGRRNRKGGSVAPPTPSAPVANFTGDVVTGYAPLTVIFSDISTGGVDTQKWYTGDPADPRDSAPGGQTTTWIYATPGTYSPSLRVENAGGFDQLTRSNYVTVLAVPAAPTCSFSIAPASGAAPFVVTLTNTTMGTVIDYVINWGDGSTETLSTLTTRTHTYSTPGTYQIQLLARGPGGDGSHTAEITATAPTPPPSTSTVTVTVFNNAPEAVVDYPAYALVGFAQSGAPTDTTRLSVLDASAVKVPCQFRVLSRWHGLREDTTKPIKAVGVVFRASIPAATTGPGGFPSAGSAQYIVQLDATANTAERGDLLLSDLGTYYRITSGVRVFEVDKTALTVFRSINYDGRQITSGVGSLECVTNAETLSASAVTTTTEEGTTSAGNVRVVLTQKGTLRTTATYTSLKYTLRYYFLEGQDDVEVAFFLENVGPYGSPGENAANTNGNVHFDRVYLKVPLTNGGTLSIRSANADRSITDSQDYRFLSSVGLLGHIADSRSYANGVQTGGSRTDHIVRYCEGANGSYSLTTDARYESGFAVSGGAAGLGVAVKDFWQLGPRSVEVRSGVLYLGVFPQDVPGEAHLRPWHFRSLYDTPYLGSLPASGLPAGNNPWVTPTRAYAPNDIAPYGYPNGATPPASGSYPTPVPSTQVQTLAQSYYRFQAGMRREFRFRLRAFATTMPSVSQLRTLRDLTQFPTIGLHSAQRYRDARTFGAYPFSAPSATASADFDVRRFERWWKLTFDDFAADPRAAGGLNYYDGWPAWRRRGKREGQTTSQLYGYPYYGCGVWGEGYNNGHYDSAFWLGLGFVRHQDFRSWAFFDQAACYYRDMGRVLCDGYVSNYQIVGTGHYEKGWWPGCDSNWPWWGHAAITGVIAYYLLSGDEAAYETLAYTAVGGTMASQNQSPASFGGRNGERVYGRALHALVDLYNVVGPIAALAPSRGGHSPQTTILGVIELAMDRWCDLEEGTINASWGRPSNQVDATHMTTGVVTSFAGQGFILQEMQQAYGTDDAGSHTTQPWMDAIVFRAMYEAIESHPTAKAQYTSTPYSRWYAVMARMRTWLRTQAIEWTGGNGGLPRVAHYWRPPTVKIANTANPGAAYLNLSGTYWEGVVANLAYAQMMLALAHLLFLNTAYANATPGDTDLDKAKQLFRFTVRYPQHGYGTIVSGLTLAAPTDPNAYVQATGLPNAAANMFPVSLHWSNFFQDAMEKGFFGGYLQAWTAVVAARREVGDL